jgi:DNA-binding response OmpR family regulator
MHEQPLLQLRVLVVEDEPIIALDIAQTLSQAGADIVGPAHSVGQAMRLIEDKHPEAAVLDWRLERETSESIALRLTSLGVPFLFHTSSRGHPHLVFPGVPIVDKPTRPDQLVAALKALTTRT